jgi:hypothetical protein
MRPDGILVLEVSYRAKFRIVPGSMRPDGSCRQMIDADEAWHRKFVAPKIRKSACLGSSD